MQTVALLYISEKMHSGQCDVSNIKDGTIQSGDNNALPLCNTANKLAIHTHIVQYAS